MKLSPAQQRAILAIDAKAPAWASAGAWPGVCTVSTACALIGRGLAEMGPAWQFVQVRLTDEGRRIAAELKASDSEAT